MGDEDQQSQRRFVRVPVETMQACVDRLNLRISGEVAGALAEDVSFRIRQIADKACQFMRHSKRNRLTVEDMDKAMRLSGLEPLYGHHSEPRQYGNLLLEQLALAYHPADDYTLPNDMPLVTAAWQVLEGVELEDNGGTVQLSDKSYESHQPFLSLILEAATGEDEDKRRLALAAVQSKPSVADILPSLIQHLQETLTIWRQLTPTQLQRVLKLSLALFSNVDLFLDPYWASIYPFLKDVLFSPSYLGVDGVVEHWHVRLVAAATMAQLIKKCGSPQSAYSQEISSQFQKQLAHPQQSSLPILYGVLHTLCHLGYTSLAEILLPHLEILVGFLQVTRTSWGTGEGISRLQEAILVAARILLTSDIAQPALQDGRSRADSSKGSPHSSGAEVTGTSRPGSVANESNFFCTTALGFNSVADNAVSAQEREASPSHLEPSSSLYSYLADLIGESLTLLLSVITHEGKQDPSIKPPRPSKPEPSKTNTENHSLERFLTKEGFLPICVQLPRTPAPPPSIPRGYYKGREPWTFHIPHPLLPRRANVLERKKSRQPPAGHDTQKVVRGKCSGHHRYYRHKCPVNIASYWV